MIKITFKFWFWLTEKLMGKRYKGAAFFMFNLVDKKTVTKKLIHHESIHYNQLNEIVFLSLIAYIVTSNLIDVQWWWSIIAIMSWHILYVTNWVVNLFVYRDRRKAYREVLFEREAYDNDQDLDYLGQRGYFAWLKFKKTK